LNASQCDLLDLPRLVSQLCALERRTVRGGRDSIDHPPGAHDDIANSVAGVLVVVAGAGGAPLQSRGAWLLAKRRAEALKASIGTAEPSGFNPALDRGPAKGGVDNRDDWRRRLDAILAGRTPNHPDGPPTRRVGMG
jgi:hypothetical protein